MSDPGNWDNCPNMRLSVSKTGSDAQLPGPRNMVRPDSFGLEFYLSNQFQRRYSEVHNCKIVVLSLDIICDAIVRTKR